MKKSDKERLFKIMRIWDEVQRQIIFDEMDAAIQKIRGIVNDID